MADANRQDLIIPADRVPVAAYQAIYHRLTKKTEGLFREFDGSYRIDRAAVEALFHRVSQALTQYRIKAQRCEITLSLHPAENYSFSSFEKFFALDFSTKSKITKQIVIEFDFLIILPTELDEIEDIPQRYKLRVECNRPGRVVHREFVDPLGRAAEVIQAFSGEPIKCHIEYVDYAVGLNLQSTVSDWISSLEYEDEESISEKTFDTFDTIATPILFSAPLLAILSGLILEVNKYNDILTPARYLLSVSFVSFLSLLVAIVLDERVDSLLFTLKSKTDLAFTAKDAVMRKLLVKNRRRSKVVLNILVVGVFVAFAVGLCVNYVFQILTESV